MKIDAKQLPRGTYVMHDGKEIHLQTWELMNVVAFRGTMQIVTDSEVICDTDFCYNIYCGEFGKRYAEMKIERTANMHLIGHPLLDVPWVKKSNYNKSFAMEKMLDKNNYVKIVYEYFRL